MGARSIVFLTLCIPISDFASGQESTTKPKAFVGKFSNGVEVEFVGLAAHPSMDSKWWKPDGTPLVERPYKKMNARMSSGPGELVFEACWRWSNLGDADVETGFSIVPNSGITGHSGGRRNGTAEQTLEKSTFAYPNGQKSCIFRFTISTPATDWVTTIENQAGHASSISMMDRSIGEVGATFLPQHADGPDTIVAVAYKIPNREVRLVAVDKDGVEHIAETGSGGGMSDYLLKEFRVKRLPASDIVTWRLQARSRKQEIREFHNVSLEPGQQTTVAIVEIKEAATVVNGTLQIAPMSQPTPMFVEPGVAPPMISGWVPVPLGQPPTNGAYAPVPAPAVDPEARFKKQQELVKTLADKHGYKLEKDELFKYIADPDIKERTELHGLIVGSMGVGEWMSQPNEQAESFEPFMLLFHADGGNLLWNSEREGIITLAEVFENVLNLKRHQIECQPGLFMTYMPGDWVLSWDPQTPHKLTDADLAAFETVLNDEKKLGVKVAWKTVEKPSLVITGKYKANPSRREASSPQMAKRLDGTFLIPVRRSKTSASVGSHDELIQSIGESLMLPVVDEAAMHPTKSDFIWQFDGDQHPGTDRLKSDIEENVLKSLHEQMGYDFKIEPREVRILSIQSAP